MSKIEVIVLRETLRDSLLSDLGTFLSLGGLIVLRQWIAPESNAAGALVFLMASIWLVFRLLRAFGRMERMSIDEAMAHLKEMKAEK